MFTTTRRGYGAGSDSPCGLPSVARLENGSYFGVCRKSKRTSEFLRRGFTDQGVADESRCRSSPPSAAGRTLARARRPHPSAAPSQNHPNTTYRIRACRSEADRILVSLPALQTLAEWLQRRQAAQDQGGVPCTVPRTTSSPPAPKGQEDHPFEAPLARGLVRRGASTRAADSQPDGVTAAHAASQSKGGET